MPLIRIVTLGSPASGVRTAARPSTVLDCVILRSARSGTMQQARTATVTSHVLIEGSGCAEDAKTLPTRSAAKLRQANVRVCRRSGCGLQLSWGCRHRGFDAAVHQRAIRDDYARRQHITLEVRSGLNLDSLLGHHAAVNGAADEDSGSRDVAGNVGARFHNDVMPGDTDQSLNPSRDDHVLVSRQLTFAHHGRSNTSAFGH